MKSVTILLVGLQALAQCPCEAPVSDYRMILGTEFSNMYREREADGPLSRSKTFVNLEFDHHFRKGWSLYTVIGARGAFGPSKDAQAQGADFQAIVKGTQHYMAGFALRWAPDWDGWPGSFLGLLAGTTWASYPARDGVDQALRDQSRSVPRLGVRLAFTLTDSVSTWSEVCVQKDALFERPTRLSALGRVTCRFAGGAGSPAFTTFLEGEINQGMGSVRNPGRVAVDPASVRLGVQLHLEKLLEGLKGTVFGG